MLKISRSFHDRQRTSIREVENWLESAEQSDPDADDDLAPEDGVSEENSPQ